MSYSVKIYKITGTGYAPNYDEFIREQIPYSDTHTDIPDSDIIDVRIDDASVDPADLFSTIGRKCKLDIVLNGKGWIFTAGYSNTSHPSYRDWLPFEFAVFRDDKIIFLGALQRANYKIDEYNYVESFYLSDSVDIFISIANKHNMVRITDSGVITVDDFLLTVYNVMKPFPRMNPTGTNNLLQSFYVSQANLTYIFPGYSPEEFNTMSSDHQYDAHFSSNGYAWISDEDDMIKVAFIIRYRTSRGWGAQGFLLSLRQDRPFDIVEPAVYIGYSYGGVQGFPYEYDLLMYLAHEGWRPYNIPDEANTVTVGDTEVMALGNTLLVSGMFYPNTQNFKREEKIINIAKAMLVANMATLQAWPRSVPFPYSSIMFMGRFDPNMEINPGTVPISRTFTDAEISHIEKRGIAYNNDIFQALDVLTDAEIKKMIMTSVFVGLNDNARYIVTFSTHISNNVSQLLIGDAIMLSAVDGVWYIIAISDIDNAGLITFSAVGGY